MSFLKNHPYSKILTVKTFLDCVGGTDYPFLRKKIAGNYLEKLLKPKTPFVFNRLGFVEKTEKMHSVSISSFESILC